MHGNKIGVRPVPTQKDSIKSRAMQNVNITRKRAGDEPVTIKKGPVADSAIKHKPNANSLAVEKTGYQIVGMAKGVTKNMDNYESLRIDVWLTDAVQAGETPQEAYERIGEVLSQVLIETFEATVSEMTEEEPEPTPPRGSRSGGRSYR